MQAKNSDLVRVCWKCHVYCGYVTYPREGSDFFVRSVIPMWMLSYTTIPIVVEYIPKEARSSKPLVLVFSNGVGV